MPIHDVVSPTDRVDRDNAHKIIKAIKGEKLQPALQYVEFRDRGSEGKTVIMLCSLRRSPVVRMPAVG